jgi:transposase
MRQKTNTYSIEFKINAIERYNSGDEGGVKALSKALGLKSYTQLFQWLKKYNEYGIAGLEDKRGKTPSPLRGRPKKQYDSLEEEIIQLKVENEYLKKIIEKNQEFIKKKQNTK